MGVPVVSVAGRTHVSRVGVSLLTAVGLSDLIAESEDQYVQIARKLAGDRRRLSELRSTLRQRMLRSPLCDEESMARAMESAYQKMWQRHLAQPARGPASSPAADTKQAVALAVRKSLAVAMSGMIMSRHFAEDFDPAAVFELERAYGREFDRAKERTFDLSSKKRLRIGYISPDFRRHAVASFMEPLLANRNRDRFEVFCYSNVSTPDAHTERFKALADETRRKLLDRLHADNGQTLNELCERLAMTRQAVTKHLVLLEEANLVATVRRGREKLHYLNPIPIHEIAERWIGKFEQSRLAALSDMKKALEANDE
jgi:DNA-binding transcriptional ArsR family regulator